ASTAARFHITKAIPSGIPTVRMPATSTAATAHEVGDFFAGDPFGPPGTVAAGLAGIFAICWLIVFPKELRPSCPKNASSPYRIRSDLFHSVLRFLPTPQGLHY